MQPTTHSLRLVSEPLAVDGATSVLPMSEIEPFEDLELLTLPRAALLRALGEEARSAAGKSGATIDLRFGESCVAVDAGSRDCDASVTLESGETIRGAALIGCDGLHSRVRKSVFGDCGVHSDGDLAAWAMLEGDALTPEVRAAIAARSPDITPGTSLFSLGNGSMSMLLVGDEHVFWFLSERQAKPYIAVPPPPPGGWPEHFRKLARDIKAEPLLGALAAATSDSNMLFIVCCDRDPLETYSHERALLIGDAAHPFTPFLGQGASQALVDAFVAAQLLAGNTESYDAVQRAFARFDELRLAPANALMLESRSMGDWFHSKSRSWLASKVLKWVSPARLIKSMYESDEKCNVDKMFPLEED